MKITPPPPYRSPTGPSNETRRAGSASHIGSATAGSEVALSATARALASLPESSEDIDLQKVQSIRSAIASGQLKIDTQQIADSLIATARMLLKH